MVEVGRHFTGVRSLFMGNPFHSMVPSFVPLLFVKIIILMKYGDLSSLEEYFFLHSWPSPFPFKVMAMAKRRKKRERE